MEYKTPQPLWDPKMAALGALSIALAIALLDLLPRWVARKVGQAEHKVEEVLT